MFRRKHQRSYRPEIGPRLHPAPPIRRFLFSSINAVWMAGLRRIGIACFLICLAVVGFVVTQRRTNAYQNSSKGLCSGPVRAACSADGCNSPGHLVGGEVSDHVPGTVNDL
jgi:hypothetical protein